MPRDVFANLSHKTRILAKLEELVSQSCLDQHQVGLARILRTRQNHSLVQAVLECSIKIERASDILIAEVLNVLVAEDLPISIRASAANTLGHLTSHRPAKANSDFDLEMVLESMVHVLRRSESPALKKALFEAIRRARGRGPRDGGRTLPRAQWIRS